MKKTLLFVSPLLSRSGYGDHAREIAHHLISKAKEYDIHFLVTPWGTNPSIASEKNDKLTKSFGPYFAKKNEIREIYDVHIQLGLPPEFKPVGKFNIGLDNREKKILYKYMGFINNFFHNLLELVLALGNYL